MIVFGSFFFVTVTSFLIITNGQTKEINWNLSRVFLKNGSPNKYISIPYGSQVKAILQLTITEFLNRRAIIRNPIQIRVKDEEKKAKSHENETPEPHAFMNLNDRATFKGNHYRFGLGQKYCKKSSVSISSALRHTSKRNFCHLTEKMCLVSYRFGLHWTSHGEPFT